MYLHVACCTLQTSLAALAFSITSETDMVDSLNFVAPSENDFHMWTDGINALLGNSVSIHVLKTLVLVIFNSLFLIFP